MAILIDTTNDNRDVKVHRAVFALGVAMLPQRQVPAMRELIEKCEGGDWFSMPYDIARVLHQQLSMRIADKLPYLKRNNASLIAWSDTENVFTVTELGERSLRKLASNIASR